MKFVINETGHNGERGGYMTNFPNSIKIETPTSALLTQGGSVVHITADVLAKIFSTPQLLWVPLSNTYHLEAGAKVQGQGIATFAGLPQHVTCATLHNVSEESPLGHFELDKVPLWTYNGKKMIDANRYMDVMEVFKPEMVLAIADDKTTLTESIKRIKKSVDRTRNMLNTCVERFANSKELQNSSLIGVIVGGSNCKRMAECVENVLKHKDVLGGVALAGLTDGGEESMDVPVEELEHIFKYVNEALPKEMVRMVEGAWNPAIIVSAIQHGWDVFDGSYPLKLTNSGFALTLNFDITHIGDEQCILDLNNDGYKNDFTPLLRGCECLACRKHTRAYVRHLLNTREMLALVLLSIHNLHHFDQLFQHIRRHISSNTYTVFKEHITKQYSSYKASMKEKENGIPEAEVKDERLKKKIRTDREDPVNGNTS